MEHEAAVMGKTDEGEETLAAEREDVALPGAYIPTS